MGIRMFQLLTTGILLSDEGMNDRGVTGGGTSKATPFACI